MRPSSSELPLYCPSCVRAGLYEPRIRNAKILLEKEKLTSQIEHITSLNNQEIEKAQAKNLNQNDLANKRWPIESNNIRKSQAKDRTKEIKDHSQILRDEIRAVREEIAKRKATVWKKRAERDTLLSPVPGQQNGRSEKLKEEIEKSKQSWDAAYKKALETRGFLCREAAHLYGLKRGKRLRGGVMRDHYTIGGIPVIDLKDINSARVNELTTSLTNTAHLVVLIAFYLSLRLPAEITLPHRNYPLPTICTPANSYQGREIPFPGTTPAPSSNTSPVASRHADLRPPPRPRPLFIEPENLKDKIPHIAKRDPSVFSFFVEGISLLAWDVAWLCRSQGMHTGTESWEEVCNVGRNLYNLLIPPPQPPALLRVISGRDVRQQRPSSQSIVPSGPDRTFRLGQFSHDSAHSIHENATDFARGWKVAKYTMIVDPLKRALIGEMSNAEWEVVEQDDWNDGEQLSPDKEAVLVKGENAVAIEGTSRFDAAGSIMSAGIDKRGEDRVDHREGERDVTNAGEAASNARVKGTSGWTKLKNREK